MFFESLKLFIHLILFPGSKVWCKVLLKVLFFEKKFTKFQTCKKIFFWIFSKGYIHYIKSQDTKEHVFNKIWYNWTFTAKLLTSTFPGRKCQSSYPCKLQAPVFLERPVRFFLFLKIFHIFRLNKIYFGYFGHEWKVFLTNISSNLFYLTN